MLSVMTSLGSWNGCNNPACWDNCMSNPTRLATQLVNVLNANGLDGIDIDYEWCLDTPQRLAFLPALTSSIRSQLPPGKLLTHVPMDYDLQATRPYYGLLRNGMARDVRHFPCPLTSPSWIW